MILDALILVVSAILFVLVQIFSLVSFVIPDNVQNAITYFLGHFAYLKGVFPIDTLFTALGVYATFTTLMYIFKVVHWAYGHIPWVGKHKKLPEI